jgi:hypothetical protein
MKKAIGMFVALLMALTVTGVGVAHWEKIVVINGTVTTGTLELEPSCDIWIVSPTDKPVATVENDVEGNSVTYTINNAFPCLTVAGVLDLHGIGSVPAGLKEINIYLPEGVTMVPVTGTDNYEIYDGDALIANFKLENRGNPCQIDYGDVVYVDWEIHFKEDLPQNTTYNFRIDLVYWNWNEVDICNPTINWYTWPRPSGD